MGFRWQETTEELMMVDKLIRQCMVGDNGRAEAGPYQNIRPAEAGGGRYRCPAYKLLDENVKDHKRIEDAIAVLLVKVGFQQLVHNTRIEGGTIVDGRLY